MPMIRNSSGNWRVALPTISLTAFCVVLPFLYFGIPSGHDFEFHVNSWIEVVDHWKQGVIYPHWAALAHYGYGEARFIFYPPISWTLGAFLGLILPWKVVPTAYIFLVLTFSGCSMFVLARRWLQPAEAVWAAVFYTANPYHLVVVYWRSAFAELLAAAYFPLLLLLVLQLEEEGLGVVPWLSLLVGAVWLTNVPSAVMMGYSLALLVLWLVLYRHSWKAGLYGLVSLLIGTMLAGAYLLPVFHERGWINISEVLASGVHPTANFLFTVTHDPDHNRFNRIVSVVALWEILVFALSLRLAKRRCAPKLWWAILVWGAAWTVLMVKWTLPLWNHLPELKYVQFPWRPLLCMNVPVALAIVAGFERWWLRAIVCLVAISSVPLVWARIQPPWWDSPADIQEMVENQHDKIGNEGVDEYVPAGVDPYEASQNAPLVRFEGSGTAKIRIERWRAESRSVVADSSAGGSLVLRLFNYPLWRVTVNDHVVNTSTTEPSGQMIVSIGPGENRVQIAFMPDQYRGIGVVISGMSVLVVGLIFFKSRQLVTMPA
jgi:hypothetical protein